MTKLASAGSDGIHVGDVARGLILAAQQSAANNQIINLGSGRAISQLDTMTTTVSGQSELKLILIERMHSSHRSRTHAE